MRRKKKPSRIATDTYAFVVDGITEVCYLQMLKRNERQLNVNIEPKLPHKKTLVDQYELVLRLATDYTRVFWIVDYDVITKQTKESRKGKETDEELFIRLRGKLARVSNVLVIVNNPCIELWFLLHFVQTSKFHSACSSVEKQLKKHITDYQKSQKYLTRQGNDIYLKLRKHLPQAKGNSKALGFDMNNTQKAICEMNHFFKMKEISTMLN